MSQPPDFPNAVEGRPPLPARRDARQLLAALFIFWVAWVAAVLGFVLLDQNVVGVVAAVVAVSAFAACCARLFGVLGGAHELQSWVNIDSTWLKDAVEASGWPPHAVWTAAVLLVTLDLVVFIMGLLAWTTS